MDKHKKILIDVNHAFDIHFFKNLYFELVKSGYTLEVIASEKPLSYELLEELNIPHTKIGSYGKSLFSKSINLIWLDIKMLWIVLKFRPQLMLGHISFRAAHIGWLLSIKTIIFTDTDHAKEQIRLYKPFANKIVTPHSFKGDLGAGHLRINTIFELAYLHPYYFIPNKDYLKGLNLDLNQPIFLLRFVSWDATHDKGESGLSIADKASLISFLAPRGRIFITSEEKLSLQYEPYRINISPAHIHHLMAHSSIYIGEGGTMASEAAILGVPSIFTSTLTLGYTEELESKWGLLKRTTDIDEIVEFIQSLLENKDTQQNWKKRHEKMLAHLVSPTPFMHNMVNDIFNKII